jgi:hypothetical protein
MGYGFQKGLMTFLAILSGMGSVIGVIVLFTVDFQAQSPDAFPLTVVLLILFSVATFALWGVRGHFAYRKAYHQQIKEEHPDERWREYHQWGGSEIVQWLPEQQAGLLLVVGIGVLAGGIITYFNIHDAVVSGSDLSWMAFIPIGIPVLFAPWAVNRARVLAKRGPFRVKMESTPYLVGEPIRGKIILNDGGIAFNEKLTIQLLCRNKGKNGNASRSSDNGPDAEKEAKWKSKISVAVPEANATGEVVLPFEFQPPADLPSAELKNTVPRITWTLRMRGIYSKRMYDYVVELPVFRPDDPVLS